MIVFRSSLLAYSETFISEQAGALARWEPWLLGEHRVPSGLDVSGLRPRVTNDASLSLIERALNRVQTLANWPASRLLHEAKTIAPALVHAHFGIDAVRIGPVAKRLRVPMLVTLHGFDINTHREYWTSGRMGIANRAYPDRLVRLGADPTVLFVAASSAIRERAIEFGIPAGRVVVHHIGVDVRRFSPSGAPVASRPPTVLFVGRLVENKGCDVLIQAMADVGQRVASAKLIMIGDGERRAELEAMARRLSVNVEFRGARTREHVIREFSKARVLCLPSVTVESGQSEGLGMVLLEAQAAGVPVVTSSRGGVRDALLDNVTGFAFAERDSAALSRHLVSLLEDDALAARMSMAGVDFVRRRFDLRERTAELERIYDRHVEFSAAYR